MKNIVQALKVVALALILSFGISYVYAWTAPTQRPPSGNVSAPINTSATEQYKEGTLGIGGLIRGYANAIFDGNVGIGTTNPAVKLDVAGALTTTGIATLNGVYVGQADSMGTITAEPGGTALRLKARAGNQPDLVIATTGNVGIGVSTPSEKLDVAGNIKGTGLCIGTDCKTVWPTGGGGGATPPAGSEFLDTSATAQTKAGWLKAVGGNGGDPASRMGVGNNWWMSENTNGNYAIHRNGVGDKLTMDTSGNVGLTGGLTAAGNIQGQHIKFPGVGGNSGAGADVYAIYQESGPWSHPYPDLRIQYHTGIKYDAYQGYGGHQFYTGWDGSGNPAGLQMQITDQVYVPSRLSVGTTGYTNAGITSIGSTYGIYGQGSSYGIFGQGSYAGSYSTANTYGSMSVGGSVGSYSNGTSYGTLAYGGAYGSYAYGGSIGSYSYGRQIGNYVYGGSYGAYSVGGSYGTLSYGGPIGILAYGSTNDFYGAHGEKTVGGTWVNASDRNQKENFRSLDNQLILNKIIELPIIEWNYKSVKDAKHIGPVSQDFYSIFGLGSDDISISTIDPAGISLVGIKALNEKIVDQQKQIDGLKESNNALVSRMERLEAMGVGL